MASSILVKPSSCLIFLMSEIQNHKINLVTVHGLRGTIIGLYVAISIFGCVWVVDEYDEIKLLMLSFVGVPTLTLSGLLYFYGNLVNELQLRLLRLILSVSLVTFLPGVLSCFNFIFSSQDTVKVFDVSQRVTTMEFGHKRGRLGVLYRNRF